MLKMPKRLKGLKGLESEVRFPDCSQIAVLGAGIGGYILPADRLK